MNASVMNRFIPLASVLGAIGIVAACGSSEADPEGTSATAGVGGTAASGAPGSSGTPRSGTGGSGGTADSGGAAESDCPSSGPLGDGGASATGGDGEGNLACTPLVCFGPPLATLGLPFVNSAWSLGGEEGVSMADVRSSEPGTVCMSGTNVDGVSLDLQLAEGDAPFTTVAANAPLVLTPAQLFHAGALGITGLSFTIETPPNTGVAPSILTWTVCGPPTTYRAEQDGNPVVITTSGVTTTLAFADFPAQDRTQPFDANALSQLNFTVGAGAYDFCVSNLKFLDANGDEVTP
jgi:hypothetical protein